MIRWFPEQKRDDLNLVGGKGVNLGLMLKLGLLVPEGFCVTTRALDRWLEGTNRWKHRNRNSLKEKWGGI